MSYYSPAENISAAARASLKQESNRRSITILLIVLVVLLIIIFAYMYIRVLISVKNTTNGGGGGGGGTPATGCTTDSQCPSSAPKCDTASKTCVVCLGNGDCSGNVTVCNTSTHTCVQCIDNTTCLGGEQCKTDIGQCVECFAGTDCGAGGVCTNNICVCNIVAPNQITNANIASNGGPNCGDYNLTGSWNSVPGAISYDVQVNGFDTNPPAHAASIRALGLTNSFISGNIIDVFNDAPQGYPTQWCGGGLTIQVRAVFNCGASNYTSPSNISGPGACC